MFLVPKDETMIDVDVYVRVDLYERLVTLGADMSKILQDAIMKELGFEKND